MIIIVNRNIRKRSLYTDTAQYTQRTRERSAVHTVRENENTETTFELAFEVSRAATHLVHWMHGALKPEPSSYYGSTSRLVDETDELIEPRLRCTMTHHHRILDAEAPPVSWADNVRRRPAAVDAGYSPGSSGIQTREQRSTNGPTSTSISSRLGILSP